MKVRNWNPLGADAPNASQVAISNLAQRAVDGARIAGERASKTTGSVRTLWLKAKDLYRALKRHVEAYMMTTPSADLSTLKAELAEADKAASRARAAEKVSLLKPNPQEAPLVASSSDIGTNVAIILTILFGAYALTR